MAHELGAIKEAVIKGKHGEIEQLVKALIENKVDLQEIINEGMIAAMDEVGRMFSEGEVFVPEMLVSSFTMKKGLDLIKPLIKDEEAESRGTVVMCTVKGDIHDIGKNLVCMMLEGAGFQVIDLGVDTTVEQLMAKVEETRPHMLGLSALLTTTMLEMKTVIDTLESRGLRDRVKVMIGGAPVDAAFAKEIKADGYGKDAVEAVRLARGFTPEKG
jgi:5-methyltetrahydrofolate--homocysteine methyltransferase